MRCRACDAAVTSVVDLGNQPVVTTFPLLSDPPDDVLPLRLGICESCCLVQLADPSPSEVDDPEMPLPTSSSTMTAHARSFAADLVTRGLAASNMRVLSVASHGGHLAPFLSEIGLRPVVLDGLEERARRLRSEGVAALHGTIDGTTLVPELEHEQFDLIVDNYLLSHVDQPRVALARMAALLAPTGTLVVEFDDLAAKVVGGQWDAIRHGHRSYLAVSWVRAELGRLGLTIVDAVAYPVYGGAVRIYARRHGRPAASVDALLEKDSFEGIDRPIGLARLGEAVERSRRDVLSYLRAAKSAGRPIVGYGAPARSVTFLNTLGVDPELLPFVVDRSPAKIGRAVPGVRIPIRPVASLGDDHPAEVLILTWDLVDEVRSALAPIVAAGTRLRVAIPTFVDVTER